MLKVGLDNNVCQFRTNLILFFIFPVFQQGNLAELQTTLRMPVDVYRLLLSKVKPIIKKQHTKFRKPICAEVRLAICLRFLALGDGFRSLSQQFRVGLSTTRQIVKETCQAIIAALQEQYLDIEIDSAVGKHHKV